jgi:hypothetical protein
MRTRQLAVFAPVLALLLTPAHAAAVVVVRARPVAAVAVVAVATRPVYVAPAPVYYAPPPTVVVTAPPAPPPPASTEKLPVNTTMWTLPSGCLTMSVGGQELFQCGPNYLKAYPSEKGTYYAVVAPP